MPTISEASAAPPDVERMSRLQTLALLACVMAFTFDLFEIGMGSVLSAVFSTPPLQLPGNQLAWLLSSVYLGAIVGAPLCGWLADHFGRRRLLAATLVWMALTSLGAAFSAGALSLGLWRGLSGLALGAFPPLMVAYLAEVLPGSRRGMLLFVVSALAFLGPPVGVFLIRSYAPLQPMGLDSWRWAFIAGSSGALVASAFYLWLPESPGWLRERGRQAQADAAERRWAASPTWVTFRVHSGAAASAVPVARESVVRTRQGMRLALVYVLSFLCPWFSIGFGLVSGAVLAQKGFHLSDTLLYMGVATLGPTVGTLIASAVVDRIGRRLLLAVCAAAMVVAGGVFSASEALLPMAVASLVFNVLFALYVPGLNLYVADLFPTRIRAWAVATAWAFNRAGAALTPLVLLPVLKSAGPVAMFSVIAVTLVATLALLKIDPT